MKSFSVLLSHTRVSTLLAASIWTAIHLGAAHQSWRYPAGRVAAGGRIRRRLAEISAQQLVEGLTATLGKTHHAHQRALAAEDRENRHQQHPQLR